jgi:hypothetical protein
MVSAPHSDVDTRPEAGRGRPAAGCIELWAGWLDVVGIELMRIAASVPAEERLRASRLPSKRDEVRFLAARGIVRDVLAGVLARAPRDVELDADATCVLGEKAVRIGVAQASGLLVCAVSGDRAVRVGLDRRRDAAGATVPGADASPPGWGREVVQLAPGYVATVAAPGSDWTLVSRWWASAGSDAPPAFVGMSMPDPAGA